MIRSAPFKISRNQFARAASLQYYRRMWQAVAAFPIFGLAAMLLGQSPLIRAIGFLALLWPLSVPARVLASSWRKASRLADSTWVGLEDRTLYFYGPDGTGMKLPLDQVRGVSRLEGLYVFETVRFNFALIPIDAFASEDREAFESAVGLKPLAAQ